jgi:hypothetical protein
MFRTQAEQGARTPTLGKTTGKTLINVTDLLHRMTELEKQVSRIPELEARIAKLEAERQQQQSQLPQQYQQPQQSPQPQQYHQPQQYPIGIGQTGLQDVASLWRSAPVTTTQPIPTSAGIGAGYANPA